MKLKEARSSGKKGRRQRVVRKLGSPNPPPGSQTLRVIKRRKAAAGWVNFRILKGTKTALVKKGPS